jgi:hypothetical protein
MRLGCLDHFSCYLTLLYHQVSSITVAQIFVCPQTAWINIKLPYALCCEHLLYLSGLKLQQAIQRVTLRFLNIPSVFGPYLFLWWSVELVFKWCCIWLPNIGSMNGMNDLCIIDITMDVDSLLCFYFRTKCLQCEEWIHHEAAELSH